jgi:hypothetical protein
VALPETPQQQLEWEARQRPRAAVAAMAAGLLIFGGQLARGLLFQDPPRARLLDSLERLQAAGPVGGLPSAQIALQEYLDERAADFLATSVAEGLGYFAVAYALTFLAAATRARRSAAPRMMLYLPAVGGVLMGVVTVAGAFGALADSRAFLDGPRTVDAAAEGPGTFTVLAQVLLLPGGLALVAAYFLVSLNAMRAGLLTRFLGILGVIVGALVIIRIGPLPVVPAFWLISLAVLFAGRRPGGELPAWRTGREEPWPTGREVAAARAAKAEAARKRAEAEPPEEEEPVAAGSHAASQRRKRKRRR